MWPDIKDCEAFALTHGFALDLGTFVSKANAIAIAADQRAAHGPRRRQVLPPIVSGARGTFRRHQLVKIRGRWECSNCAAKAATTGYMKKLLSSRCRGSRVAHLQVVGGSTGGHLLAKACADNGDVVLFCMACGAWTTSAARHLRLGCPGAAAATPAGKEVLRRVSAGKHPRKAARLLSLPQLVPAFARGAQLPAQWMPSTRLHTKTSAAAYASRF